MNSPNPAGESSVMAFKKNVAGCLHGGPSFVLEVEIGEDPKDTR